MAAGVVSPPKSCLHLMTPRLRARLNPPGFPESQSDPESPPTQSTPSEWYEIDSIIAEKATRYRVRWKGTDPQTGLPWKAEWIKKSEVTQDARAEWEAHKKSKLDAQRRRRRRRRRHVTLPREDSPNSARARNSPASLLESSPNSSAAIPDPNHQPSRKAALPLPGPAESPLPRTVHPDSSASSAASAPSDHFADPSSASISRVSVLIKRPLGFDATAYPRLSDIILAPSTFPDSSFPFSVPAPASQDNPTDTAQLSIVIPDSQGFDDSASFSTFLSSPLKHHEASPAKHDIGVSFLDEAFGYNESQLQPTEISPPPSYEESTTQSTTNSGASQVQVSEVAVQTSPPALDSVEPEDQEIEKDLGEESFDLDLPQNLDLSYRLEDLSFNPPPRENESAQDPGQQDTPIVDISNRDSVKEPVEETRQNEQLSIGISGEISAKTTQKPEEFENTTGPLFHNNNQAQDSERRVSKKRTRRKRLSGDRLEDWFRVNKRPRFVPEPLSSQEFPLPPDTISAYTDPSFPRPPSLSSSMSQASSASPRPLSLKEKVEAHLRHMEEQLEQRKRRSSIARSSPASTTREILSPFRPSPAPPLFESQQEPDAQLPAHSIPPPVQSFTATEGSTTAPNPTKSTQDSSLGHIPNSMVQSQFGPAVFEEEEYAIALPLSTATVPSDGLNQKSVYMHEIYEKQADIEEYLAKRDKPESRGNKIAFNLVRTIGQIATHPNLVYPVEPWPSDEQEAQYQAVMSAKFHFLHELFDLIKDENVKIAVVAEAPQLINMLEVFFRGHRISHKRLDKLSDREPLSEDDIEGMVQVFLVPSAPGSGAVGSECHLVIAMDSTFNAWSPEVIQIRKNTYNPTKVAPVLRLVAINTIEHALLCVSSEANGLYACVEAVMILRNEAGVVDPAYEAALGSAPKETARWIKNRCKGKYNIPAFPELPLFETVAASQASGTDDAHIDKRKRQNTFSQPEPVDPKKRKILDAQPAPSSAPEADISHVTNTMPSTTHPTPKAPPSLPPTRVEVVSRLDSMESSEDHSIAQPMEIDDDETESDEVPEDDPIFLYQRFLPDTPSAHPQPRQEACRDTSAALSSWMESAARLQTRFEETRQLLRDKNAVITKAERLEKQALAARDRALAEMEKLKIQNTELRQQLEAAGAPGSSHQELVRLFFENTELKKKLDHANNKVQASERDAGFAREQYQFASTATYEMRKELDGVQAANTELQRKADARAIKLREMAMANAATARDAEIEELNIRLKEREDRIARLEQREVYGLKRGSVPRRVGSPALSRGSSPGLAALRRGEV